MQSEIELYITLYN